MNMRLTFYPALLTSVGFVIAGVLVGFVLMISLAQPAEASPFCAYNSTQSICACPTSGPGVTCLGGQLYNPSNGQCYNDPRPGVSNQRLDCGIGALVCDTPNYPCSACRVALSSNGQDCSGDTSCPASGGQYANVCSDASNSYGQNAYKCPSGTTYCSATSGVTYPNTCVTNRVCPAGTTWNPCNDSCDTPNVLLSPGVDIGSPFVQSGYIKISGDIESTAGSVISANTMTAPSYCIGTDCVTGWADLSRWTLVGNDIYNSNVGNVGIGTTVPQSKLHIQGSGVGFGVTFTNTGNTAGKRGMRLAFDNDRFTIQRASDAGVWEEDYFSIDQDTGWVGIGTTVPNNRLQVANLISFDPTYFNTFLGQGAGANLSPPTTANESRYNTFVGHAAGTGNTTGWKNVGIGPYAYYSPDVAGKAYNIAIGYASLYDAYNSHNIGMGLYAGRFANYMSTNLGYLAGHGRTASAGSNHGINIGREAGRYDDNTYNVALGAWAGAGNATYGTGSMNVSIGYSALRDAYDKVGSVAVGGYALRSVTSGTGNTSLGYRTGYDGTYNVTTGSYNTFLGYQAGLASTGSQYNYATAIGYNAKVGCSDCFVLGRSGVKVGIATSSPGYPLDVLSSGGTAMMRLKGTPTTLWTGIRLDSARAPATTNDEKWFLGMNATDATLRFRAGGSGDVMTVTQGGDVSASGCFGPVYDSMTALTFNGGNPGGYVNANALCPGNTHVCTPDEIMRTVECGASFPVSGSSWVNNGPPGFTSPAANDCSGWTSASGSAYGTYWQFDSAGGKGSATACNVALPFACCK